jgi:hypothetical protein
MRLLPVVVGAFLAPIGVALLWTSVRDLGRDG